MMDPLKGKHTYFQRILHKFQARRDIPFRRKFFVGYDLAGNTYWEFTIDGNMQRLRRKLEPYEKMIFKVDYFKNVPPQWLQWLRRTRQQPPTLEELINDQVRQQKIKVLAKQADEKWTMEKSRLEREHQLKLANELERAKAEAEEFKGKASQNASEDINPVSPVDVPDSSNHIESVTFNPESEDPWRKAEESRNKNPIESSNIKPRS